MGKWHWTTAKQYAEYVGFDIQYVRRLIRQGIIPALVTPGGHFRIDIPMADAALEEYMRRPKPLPEKPKKEFDTFGKEANRAMKEAGGFRAALRASVMGEEVAG